MAFIRKVILCKELTKYKKNNAKKFLFKNNKMNIILMNIITNIFVIMLSVI